MSAPVLHVLTYTYHPYGGVVKTLDYALHALSLGFRVSVSSPEEHDPAGEVFQVARLAALVEDDRVEFHSRANLDAGPDDLFLFSIPTDYDRVLKNLPRGASPERMIHLVQNTRHANPWWMGGYPMRVLTRPASRITTSPAVTEAIRPWVDPRSLLRTVLIGHDLDVFRHEREGGFGDGPIRVLHTTWKSEVGDAVARALADDPRFEFRAVRGTTSWAELRDHYAWSDVFLSTPNRQEGTYLPGLEAMAAGSLVVTPDVGGNMDYCRPDDNCLLVGFGDVEGYARALRELADAPADRVAQLRKAAYDVTADFGLDREREGFAAFLEELGPRLAARERRTPETRP